MIRSVLTNLLLSKKYDAIEAFLNRYESEGSFGEIDSGERNGPDAAHLPKHQITQEDIVRARELLTEVQSDEGALRTLFESPHHELDTLLTFFIRDALAKDLESNRPAHILDEDITRTRQQKAFLQDIHLKPLAERLGVELTCINTAYAGHESTQTVNAAASHKVTILFADSHYDLLLDPETPPSSPVSDPRLEMSRDAVQLKSQLNVLVKILNEFGSRAHSREAFFEHLNTENDGAIRSLLKRFARRNGLDVAALIELAKTHPPRERNAWLSGLTSQRLFRLLQRACSIKH